MGGSPKLTNADLFLYALYRLGGAGKYIDVEDVFMEMWRLAPARFSWRKYQQPNYKIMSKAIVDIDQRGDGNLLLGTGDSRQLSAQGVEWTERRLKQFERIASGEDRAAPERRPSQRVTVELAKARPVREFEREELGIKRGNGTVVTVTASPSHRCPHHDNLAEQLQQHFQLRDIMADPKRELILVNLTRREQRRLKYGLDLDSVEQVVDQDLDIEGYPEARPRLRLWRLPDRCEQPRSEPARPCGILVKGRRAIYENTLFGFENNPHAGWYTGRLDCPYVDQLANEYDDQRERDERHPESNPIPIISRRREGLAPDHPFAKALAAAVDDVLAERVRIEEEREREDSAGVENERTRRRLDRMATEAARFLQEAMREIEAEEPAVGAEGEVEPLQLVPPEVVIRLDEERTLSLLAQADGLPDGAEVDVKTEPEGVVEVLDGLSVALHPHKRRRGVLSGQIHLRPLVEAETLINASIDGREALGLVTVKPPLEDEDEDAECPEGLEFERPRYKVRWNKRKELELRAPASLVAELGNEVHVTSNNEGVAVTRGGKVTLVVNEDNGIATGKCRIEGRKLGARATIRAALAGDTAQCRVSVEQRDEGLPDLRIDIVSENPSLYRALFDPPEVEPGEQQTLKIFARHSALKRYLGEAPEYAGQDSPEWQAVQAEVVTEAIVRRIVSRKYPAGSEDVDADQIYYDHFSYTSRLLPLMQREASAH
jgi:hypothetical protein